MAIVDGSTASASSSSCCPTAAGSSCSSNGSNRPSCSRRRPPSPRRLNEAEDDGGRGRQQQQQQGQEQRRLPPSHRRLALLPSVLLALLLALVLLQPPAVGAIQLDVDPYTTRCLMDEYAPEEESALKVRAVGRVQDGVRATVSGPEDQAVWDGYLTATEQEVPLPEEEYGLYRICVHNGAAAVQRVEVGTLERAVKLSNKDAKLTKEHLRPLQLLFRRAELTVLGVSKELDNVRQREAALRETSETTDSRIQWFSIFSIVILLAVATWQVVFLKQFFRSKKLL